MVSNFLKVHRFPEMEGIAIEPGSNRDPEATSTRVDSPASMRSRRAALVGSADHVLQDIYWLREALGIDTILVHAISVRWQRQMRAQA